MSDFLDFDSLEMEANENASSAKEHPLKDLAKSAKMAYVGGLLFACHADDNELQKEEKSHVVGVAGSLGVGKEEVNELAAMVEGLTDKIGYLKEIVALLKDRKTILFFLLDTIKAMGSDGDLNENAQKLLDGIGKLAKLKQEDAEIVRAYGAILVGKSSYTDDELALNLGAVNKAGVAKDLHDWFVPEKFKTMKIELAERVKKEEKERKDAEKKAKAEEKKRLAAEKKAKGGTPKKVSKSESKGETAPVRTVTPKESFVDLLRSEFEEFVNRHPNSDMQNNLYANNSAPIKKQMNASASMQVQETDYIFQLDDTLWGGAREGVIITPAAIYWHNPLSDPGRIEWGDLQDDSWVSETTLYLNGNDVSVTLMGEEVAEEFASLLNNLVKKLHTGNYTYP